MCKSKRGELYLQMNLLDIASPKFHEKSYKSSALISSNSGHMNPHLINSPMSVSHSKNQMKTALISPHFHFLQGDPLITTTIRIQFWGWNIRFIIHEFKYGIKQDRFYRYDIWLLNDRFHVPGPFQQNRYQVSEKACSGIPSWETTERSI